MRLKLEVDFDTLEEALQTFHDPFTVFKGPNEQSGESYYGGSELWIELDGQIDPATGDNLVRRACKGKLRQDSSWQRETAMEAGMLHGVDAYNEMMGY